MVKTRCIGVIFGLVLATTGWAATTSPSLIATPPQPKWSELTVAQKVVLAPLSDDWDSLEYYRQKKWLTIVTRFPTLAPEEQRRIQGQMQEWDKLTVEQRQRARQNFKAASQLPDEKKQELKQKWEEYSNLPDAEKEKLKQQASSKPVPKPGRSTVAAPMLPPSVSTPALIPAPIAPPAVATLPPTETVPPAVTPTAAPVAAELPAKP